MVKSKPPIRKKNKESRTREYLTEDEVIALVQLARMSGKNKARNACMILLAYHHGLRASELVSLKREQINIDQGIIHIVRSKRGVPSTHPLPGDDIRALRKVLAENTGSQYIFLSTRGKPLSTRSFGALVHDLGKRCGIPFPVHPHMLRHACGYKLANEGHDTRAIQLYLGHQDIRHTVRYTELAPDRFRGFWRE